MLMTPRFGHRFTGGEHRKRAMYSLRGDPQLPHQHSGGAPRQARVWISQRRSSGCYAGSISLLRGLPTLEGQFN